jgi:antitoxin (DNA-binding transcriptional repressor) of toxin-antitoxin stability system
MRVNIYAAKTHLSRLIDQVNAGEEIVITRQWRSSRALGTRERGESKQRLGTLKGESGSAKEFDEPLPDDLLDLFEGKGKHPLDQRLTA